MSAAEAGGVFRRARGRTLDAFLSEKEREWKGPFYFIQGADPQFGLMKAWSTGDSDSGGDEWGQEIRLTEQAVEAINKLKPKPKFFVLCGDLIHAMPGMPWRKEQTADLQRVLARVDRDIPLVLVSGNHDVGNTPTPETVAEFQQTWGDDYFSFWVGGVLFLVLNSQFWYDASRCPALKQAQDQWLDQQLRVAGRRHCQHAIVFQHIPLFLHSIDEDDDYFNLTKSVRKEVANKLSRADPEQTKGNVGKRSETRCGPARWQAERPACFGSRGRWAVGDMRTRDSVTQAVARVTECNSRTCLGKPKVPVTFCKID
ncbi:serine/threonine-protein phosphatase CPPED1 isoform X2 [Mustela erminea]|uniref:serine/threonine-protein phosphatase CPPED1 isoform X2 n=1 Tax=Mustela erminea TaxID=36723 RepID=UPI0013869973|nr:serine/threonine-protein phosphatase CPPED1 isoform X2 [Mustela erminea]